MSEQKWTSEPWRVESADHGVWITSPDAGVGDICDLYHYTRISDDDGVDTFQKDNAEANAQRIVTCVNACQGAPAMIQPGATKALADALEEVIAISDRKHNAWDRAKQALRLYHGDE